MEEFFDNGYIKYNDFKLESKDDGVILSVELNENLLNPYKMPHGGLIYSLADTACGVCAYYAGVKCVTVNASIEYLTRAKGNKLFAKAKILKKGLSIVFLECNIYDLYNNLIAIMHSSYYVIK